jgi:hypothetical protein
MNMTFRTIPAMALGAAVLTIAPVGLALTLSTVGTRTPFHSQRSVATDATTTTTPAGASTSGRRREAPWATVDENAVTSFGSGGLQAELATLPTSTLTAVDRAGLQFMREEEKLALDLYTVLGNRWKVNQFRNIARAEATHTSAVKALLDRYGIQDPASTRVGVFKNPTLQAMYKKLLRQGSTSATEALNVGAIVEETDIADLRARASTAADIELVYGNLERGSRNHLRAFVSALYLRGTSYVPTVLSSADFEAIIDSPAETGPLWP